MVSVVTNWGKCSQGAAFLCGTDADGAALPAALFCILIDNTYPDWASPNPDHNQISQITGRIDPAGYTVNGGNNLPRNSAFWTRSVNNTLDRGELALASPFTVLAGASPIANVRGWALCSANNISTAAVAIIYAFAAAQTINANQQATIAGSQLYLTPP